MNEEVKRCLVTVSNILSITPNYKNGYQFLLKCGQPFISLGNRLYSIYCGVIKEHPTPLDIVELTQCDKLLIKRSEESVDSASKLITTYDISGELEEYVKSIEEYFSNFGVHNLTSDNTRYGDEICKVLSHDCNSTAVENYINKTLSILNNWNSCDATTTDDSSTSSADHSILWDYRLVLLAGLGAAVTLLYAGYSYGVLKGKKGAMLSLTKEMEQRYSNNLIEKTKQKHSIEETKQKYSTDLIYDDMPDQGTLIAKASTLYQMLGGMLGLNGTYSMPADADIEELLDNGASTSKNNEDVSSRLCNNDMEVCNNNSEEYPSCSIATNTFKYKRCGTVNNTGIRALAKTNDSKRVFGHYDNVSHEHNEHIYNEPVYNTEPVCTSHAHTGASTSKNNEDVSSRLCNNDMEVCNNNLEEYPSCSIAIDTFRCRPDSPANLDNIDIDAKIVGHSIYL